MAEGKRGAGFLHQRVLQLLKASCPHPLSGLQLVGLLQEEGEMVPASQVYRALKRLIEEGMARKVLLAGAYVPVGRDPAILLWCPRCCTVQEVACPEVFRRLDARAGAAGLAAPRAIVEVPGLCAACAGR